MIHFKDIVAQHGGDPGCFFHFEDKDDQIHLLPYATLTTARATSAALKSLVGVYEWQSTPLFMLIDGDALGSDPDNFTRVRRLVALRGDSPYLAIVQGGRVVFHDVALDNRTQAQTEALEPDEESTLAIPHIANVRPRKVMKERWISDVILKLLTDALDALTTLGINSGDAISLVGRVLFTRFLADRGLLQGQAFAQTSQAIEALFEDVQKTQAISAWLDTTFNGDFLPLTVERISALPQGAFHAVSNIMRKTPGGQHNLEWSEDWANLDFAHIPVGVLSQAYERYLGKLQAGKQKKEGSFYTPRHIAELMIHASFEALRRDGVAHKAKILDPAAGAGVFLITAFRQLVKERWLKDGAENRPQTETLRDILYDQIRGFDINDSALRFAALGLYLIAIELDPAPMPVEKLKFPKNLRQGVILKLGMDDDPKGSRDLGSLGNDIGPEHVGEYDLIIGNPPWSSNVDLSDWRVVTDRVRKIARARLRDPDIDPPLPNGVLDLPFVWRAMEWAKPGAQIALALHARLLFQRGEGMDRAFSSILRSVDVTGIINGAEVRQSKVWPNVEAPFCILFAKNVRPGPEAGFQFVSPHLEGPLNNAGGWRIDTARTATVSSAEILKRPELMKILYRGSQLDRDILDRVFRKGFSSFGEYWSELHGGTVRQPKCAGNGYKKLLTKSRPNPSEGNQKGYSAEKMFSYPVLEHAAFQGILLKSDHYRKFRELGFDRLDQRRDLSLYSGPMLLVKKSPNVGTPRIRCAVSTDNLVFNETYYGYTAHRQSDALDLVKYLCLVIGSEFALWYCLVTSGEFGFERDVIEKYVIQEIPLPHFAELNTEQQKKVRSLFDGLAADESLERWRAVDEWVASLFDLTSDDAQTISDTLAFSLPYEVNEIAARIPPSADALDEYRARLKADLDPWSERYGRSLFISKGTPPPLSPWQFVVISAKGDPLGPPEFDTALRQAMEQIADDLSSTEIIFRDEANDCLILGRLNQARYWSISEARLAARRIIWEHVDFLSGRKAA